MTFEQIKAAHPAPWRYSILGNEVIVLDAAGARVELFTLLDMVMAITAGMAANAAPGPR